MVRLPVSDANHRTRDGSSNPDREETASGGLGRTVLLALAIGAILYLLVRRGRSADPDLPTDEIRETAETVLEGGREIPIEDPIREIPDDADALPAADDDTLDSQLDEEPSAEEVAERVEADVQETPAEPGELTVDEEVAAEVVDEAELEAADADEAANDDEEADADAEPDADEPVEETDERTETDADPDADEGDR